MVHHALEGHPLEIAEKIASLGCLAFLTTPDLRGRKLAPVREVPRRILVLYGWDCTETELPPKFAADTLTAERLQMPLEWLGYEVDAEGVKIMDRKVKSITALEFPNTPKRLRSWLGATNQFIKFVPNLAETSAPLRAMLKGGPRK